MGSISSRLRRSSLARAIVVSRPPADTKARRWLASCATACATGLAAEILHMRDLPTSRMASARTSRPPAEARPAARHGFLSLQSESKASSCASSAPSRAERTSQASAAPTSIPPPRRNRSHRSTVPSAWATLGRTTASVLAGEATRSATARRNSGGVRFSGPPNFRAHLQPLSTLASAQTAEHCILPSALPACLRSGSRTPPSASASPLS
mmetsp:Transcript_91196/g.288992  ORF Transcript_91196/g.288992 Transcript_91196/m.288992 type:complete len:210 (-) Transcript_91196:416-1045(-)